MSLDQRTSLIGTVGNSSFLERFFERALSRLLPEVQFGHLELTLPSRHVIRRGLSKRQPAAKLEIRRWRTLLKLVLHGDAGFAHAYEKGDVAIEDLSALFDFVLLNRAALEKSMSPSKIGLALSRLRHRLRRNDRKGSRRNISAHYDLGNDFYRAWLDEGMNYSSALFEAEDQSLETAQRKKINRIIELLQPNARSSVLEIGCGWGALMEELVSSFHCNVTGITLSREQSAYAEARLSDAIADGSAVVELKDYRDCKAQFDRIVSVEMIEAVGEDYWPVYFSTLRKCLTRDGIAVIQAITIAEERFAVYREEPDFIQQRIFPGGMLPTVGAIEKHAKNAGLKLAHTEFFGASYAQTLAEWRRRFNAAWPRIKPLGFDERFKRLWNYYLAYCEAGFRHQATDVGFYVLKVAS